MQLHDRMKKKSEKVMEGKNADKRKRTMGN